MWTVPVAFTGVEIPLDWVYIFSRGNRIDAGEKHLRAGLNYFCKERREFDIKSPHSSAIWLNVCLWTRLHSMRAQFINAITRVYKFLPKILHYFVTKRLTESFVDKKIVNQSWIIPGTVTCTGSKLLRTLMWPKHMIRSNQPPIPHLMLKISIF